MNVFAPFMHCAAPVPGLRAVVIIPARNEEETLPATLEALRLQAALDGTPLPPDSYEILLLLNNCTDRSAAVARAYAAAHRALQLHVVECALPPEQAHVGTARRLLMDAACARLESLDLTQEPCLSQESCAILSTDADSLVAPDWIACNRAAMAAGAEVVGGVIHLFPQDLAALTPHVRRAYQMDRTLQRLTARLESLLDPDAADPWPRHLEHFGASLACTPAVYRRSGGLPPVKPLEDVAFVEALRRVDARIRHAPDVHIATSARLDGRAEVGLSGQLRHWQQDGDQGRVHLVESAAWLAHRFACMGSLRRLFHAPAGTEPSGILNLSRAQIVQAAAATSFSAFLVDIDCDRLIDEAFTGQRHEEIASAITRLEDAITQAEARTPTLDVANAPAHPA